jgi:hypothetical protein
LSGTVIKTWQMTAILQNFRDPDYSNHPAYSGPISLRLRWRAICRFAPLFLRNLIELTRRRKHWAVLNDDAARSTDPKFKELLEKGIAPYRLAPEQKLKLLSLCKSPIQKLRDTRTEMRAKSTEAKSYSEVNLKLRRNDEPELFEFIENILREQNIYSTVKAYNGYSIAINTVCVQINDKEDKYWTNHFKDISLKDPPTSYMHVDSSVGYLKCIFYLNEVSEKNGCFRYLVGSQRILKRRFWDFAIRRANDMSGLDKTDADTRLLFTALPSFLKRKAEMGNDYLAGSPMIQELLSAEKLFTSKEADMVLFDTDGIHRGAIIEDGERVILQVALVPPEHVRA